MACRSRLTWSLAVPQVSASSLSLSGMLGSLRTARFSYARVPAQLLRLPGQSRLLPSQTLRCMAANGRRKKDAEESELGFALDSVLLFVVEQWHIMAFDVHWTYGIET